MTFISRKIVLSAAALLALGAVMATAQTPQQPVELKLAYYVGDQHAMSQWLIKWADQLEKDSGGRIVVKRFPGAQMGPVQQHYDFARTGQADISWFLHGATPGRFPLTEIVQVPYLVGIRGDRHQGAERCRIAREISRSRAQGREGARTLHPSARQHAHHQKADQVRRRREGHATALRFAEIRDFVAALGATPVGVRTDRTGRAAAEGHDRRRVHRLRRRRHRFQDGRHGKALDRDVFLRRELRPRR